MDKISHLFARRKSGATTRFLNEYRAVRSAWTADLLDIELKCQEMAKGNQAGAQLKGTMLKSRATDQAHELTRMVFADFKAEIERIATQLGGHPQEDGNVVFPDGSTARYPRGLWIPEDIRMEFRG